MDFNVPSTAEGHLRRLVSKKKKKKKGGGGFNKFVAEAFATD